MFVIKLINSVARSLKIIDLLSENVEGLSVQTISSKTDLPPSTVHRILGTLREADYVRQKPDTKKYFLTMKIALIANKITMNRSIRRVASPFLQELGKKCGENINLATLDEEKLEVIYIDRVESILPLTTFYRIGHRAPFYCTGVGKVLVSQLSGKEIRALMEKIEIKPLTENTICSVKGFLKEIELTRERGYALDNEECERGARCIAAPIYNEKGLVYAAISISGPTARFGQKEIEEYIPLILECSGKISSELGFIF